MHSALRHFIQAICGLTLLAIIATAQQPASQPSGTGTIQGRITLDKAPISGVIVMLVSSNSRFEMGELLASAPAPTATTNADGRYQFNNVKAGKYRLEAHAPAYVTENASFEEITLDDGETVDNQDFTLRRGGVITGKVVDPEGFPAIEARIGLSLVSNDSSYKGLRYSRGAKTDDRGIYRIFAIPEGDYKVSAVLDSASGDVLNPQAAFQQTYFPDVADAEEAKAVSVKPETEVTGIDITLLPAKAIEKKGLTVSGRVVSESGKPVSGAMMMLSPNGQTEKDYRPTSPSSTNGNGEFKFEGVSAGQYLVTLFNMAQFITGPSSGYAEPLKVIVNDTAVSGLEIRLKAGATLSGIVALDVKPGTRPDAAQQEMLNTLMVVATPYFDRNVEPTEGPNDPSEMMGGMGMSSVKPDQTFMISGLKPGKYQIMAESMIGKKLKILRVERNGAATPFVEVAGTEPVTNVRLVFALGSASIKGRVQVQGGRLPEGASFSIMLERQGEKRANERSEYTQSDRQGSFSLEGLLPGSYEIRVMNVNGQGEKNFDFEMPTQTVTLLENVTQPVVLYVNLVKKEK